MARERTILEAVGIVLSDRLTDRDNLVELMIKHSVGLEKIKEYVVYKINEDFFRT